MMGPSASARWCPTPDQLMILEEMYRAGVRTPNASQIQQITAHLSLYGKIEGKNVFYWFQNHKARDRQKLRRKLSKQLQLQLQFQHQHHHEQQLFQPHASDTSFLRSYLDLSPSVSACGSLQQQLAHFSSPLSPTAGSYIPQGGHSGSSSRQQMMQYNWKRNDQMDQECNNMMKRYSGGWMMLLDMDSPDLCATRPVKTLQLFPTTSAGLKEDPKVPPP